MPQRLPHPPLRASREGMPTRKVAFLGGAGGFAGIDNDEAFGVLDHPGVDGNWPNPFFIGEDIEESLSSLAPPLELGGFDAHSSCLNGVDTDHSGSLLLMGAYRE